MINTLTTQKASYPIIQIPMPASTPYSPSQFNFNQDQPLQLQQQQSDFGQN